MSTEELALLISVVSAVISLCAVYFARKTFEANILVSRNTALVAQTETNEQRLHDFPKLLKLYGIEETSLQNDGLEPVELLYIWSDLRQGEIFHRMDKFKNVDSMISDYREAFLRNDKVRVAFNKYIYRRLMSDSSYMKEVKRYLDNNP